MGEILKGTWEIRKVSKKAGLEHINIDGLVRRQVSACAALHS